MNEYVCPLCKGTRHVFVERNGKKSLVRCECYQREIYELKLQRFSLDPSFIIPHITLSGIEIPKDKDAQLVKAIYDKYLEAKSCKQVFLDTNISMEKTKRIMSFLCAVIPQEDFQIKDIADIIDDQFKNIRFQLKKVNIVTSYFSASKALRAKLLKDIKFRASMENKIVVYVTDNLSALRDDSPELSTFIKEAIKAPFI